MGKITEWKIAIIRKVSTAKGLLAPAIESIMLNQEHGQVSLIAENTASKEQANNFLGLLQKVKETETWEEADYAETDFHGLSSSASIINFGFQLKNGKKNGEYFYSLLAVLEEKEGSAELQKVSRELLAKWYYVR